MYIYTQYNASRFCDCSFATLGTAIAIAVYKMAARDKKNGSCMPPVVLHLEEAWR